MNKKIIFDPLIELINHYSKKKNDVSISIENNQSIEEKLKHRIIDGNKVGIENELNEAIQKYTALEIINTILLDGMKIVGELFGKGDMQLPFVLQSAETMKFAVSYLEKFMEKNVTTQKGVFVIATVKGDVHDIGKNLVDIILTNNGYKIINLGIKCSIETILHSAEIENTDAIGMSGLLVKSTVIMKENLEVMEGRNIKIPVILGGAALTRRFVENDLKPIYSGIVEYANDVFDGLKFMDKLISGNFSYSKTSNYKSVEKKEEKKENIFQSSNITKLEKIPTPPFIGTKIVDNILCDEIFPYINEVALFRGQWQIKKGKMNDAEYGIYLKEKIFPEYENLKLKVKEKKLLEPKLVYGYFYCQSSGNDLLIYDETKKHLTTFTFPRQNFDRYISISDFFCSIESGKFDTIAFMLVTMGKSASKYSQNLFENNNYKDYLYFHGLSVEMAEALAEFWHKKIREELHIANSDASEIKKLFSQSYCGARYSFGYPACPNLEDQTKLFKLLHPEKIGIELTEEFQLVPEQSTSAIIVHHPQAKYFNIK